MVYTWHIIWRKHMTCDMTGIKSQITGVVMGHVCIYWHITLEKKHTIGILEYLLKWKRCCTVCTNYLTTLRPLETICSMVIPGWCVSLNNWRFSKYSILKSAWKSSEAITCYSTRFFSILLKSFKYSTAALNIYIQYHPITNICVTEHD